MYKFLILLVLGILCYAENELTSLERAIDVFSKRATQTKENIFYQPYIISVYKGPQLRRAGVRTLEEALELIPGVFVNSDNIAVKTPIFRGSNPYAFGQTKLFVDGVCLNDVLMDQYSYMMWMPIELIERIEIVRGPGTHSDGESVYAGAVYVFTYANNHLLRKRFFSSIGGDGERVAGFMENFSWGQDTNLYLEGYLSRNDRAAYAGPDILATGYFGAINTSLARSGLAPLWHKNYTLALTFRHKNLTIRARDIYYKHALAFGVSFILPQKRDFYRLPQRYVEATYRGNFSDAFSYELEGTLYRNEFYLLGKLAPDGIYYSTTPCSGDIAQFDRGIYGLFDAQQQRSSLKIKFALRRRRSDIRFGVLFQKDETLKVRTMRSTPTTYLQDFSLTCPFIDPHAKRISKILFYNGSYDVTSSLRFSYGVQMEKNSLNGKFIVDPRLAMVYGGEDLVYKLSYSRSHRDPSWQELFTLNNKTRVGNRKLDAERVDAVEGSLIRRFGIDEYVQVALFFLKNKDMIDNLNARHIFLNRGSVNLYGAEIETKFALNPATILYANYSYVTGDEKLPNVAHHMVKGYLTRQFTSYLEGGVIYQCLSDRSRERGDRRNKLKGFQKIDLSLSAHLNRAASLTLYVKNIFLKGKKIYPAPPSTFVNDYPSGEERAYFLTFRWRY